MALFFFCFFVVEKNRKNNNEYLIKIIKTKKLNLWHRKYNNTTYKTTYLIQLRLGFFFFLIFDFRVANTNEKKLFFKLNIATCVNSVLLFSFLNINQP